LPNPLREKPLSGCRTPLEPGWCEVSITFVFHTHIYNTYRRTRETAAVRRFIQKNLRQTISVIIGVVGLVGTFADLLSDGQLETWGGGLAVLAIITLIFNLAWDNHKLSKRVNELENPETDFALRIIQPPQLSTNSKLFDVDFRESGELHFYARLEIINKRNETTTAKLQLVNVISELPISISNGTIRATLNNQESNSKFVLSQGSINEAVISFRADLQLHPTDSVLPQIATATEPRFIVEAKQTDGGLQLLELVCSDFQDQLADQIVSNLKNRIVGNNNVDETVKWSRYLALLDKP